MDRRHVYAPQKSLPDAAKAGGGAPPSPAANRHALSGSLGINSNNGRRPHNTKAAAQRLAQVMSNQSTTNDDDDDDDDDDDLLYDYTPANSSSAGFGLAGERPARSRSPLSARTSLESHASIRSATRMRSSPSVGSLDQQSSSDRSMPATRSSQPIPIEKPPSDRLTSATILSPSASPSSLGSIEHSPSGRPISAMKSSQLSVPEQPISSEQVQPPSARLTAGRSSQPIAVEQPPSARSTSATHPTLGPKAVSILPSSVSISLRTAVSATPSELHSDSRLTKRLSVDLGTFKHKETTTPPSSSTLQDEVDMLQEENESLLEKIRLAEERFEEAEARARLLEKQIANLGEGVSLEAHLLARKEAALQQREAALKVAAQNYGGKGEEVAALRAEAEISRDEASSAMEQLHEDENEIKSLRAMSHKMVLTQEEMEEVVLKRCWLARYWGLCVQHGIHTDVAGAKHEYWSSFSPLPNEVVLEAGQRAKSEDSLVYDDMKEGEKLQRDVEHLSDGNVESMFLVEKGLREQTVLKVEEAIALAMAQQRRSGSFKSIAADELKIPTESQNFAEAFELSQEEAEDVRFKQAWLTYFWRRAKNHGLEPDIADERLELLINNSTQQLNSHDAINVERGLMELKKLGIEDRLWKVSQTYRSRNNA